MYIFRTSAQKYANYIIFPIKNRAIPKHPSCPPRLWAMLRKPQATFREITGKAFQARRKHLYHHWK